MHGLSPVISSTLRNDVCETDLNRLPLVSVIVPAFNAAKYIRTCLDALLHSSYRDLEIIVVDDGSTDDTVAIAQSCGARVLTLSRQQGQSAARNQGARHAKGEYLFFVDADVAVHATSVERAAHHLLTHPDYAAVFGSYDDDPAVKSTLSKYKNLQHHFVHQNSKPEATTFWSGCGAVRRETFLALGGFNETMRAIEDIELGYRLHRSGYRILLDKNLQAKHLKHWTLGSWLYADIFCRAVPWSILILRSSGSPCDLNLRIRDRISAFLIVISILSLPVGLLEPVALWMIPLVTILVIYMNRDFYGFLRRRGGEAFACACILFHLGYFLYSTLTFIVCSAYYAVQRGVLGGIPRLHKQKESCILIREHQPSEIQHLASAASSADVRWIDTADTVKASRKTTGT